jgi:hypothetical protein
LALRGRGTPRAEAKFTVQKLYAGRRRAFSPRFLLETQSLFAALSPTRDLFFAMPPHQHPFSVAVEPQTFSYAPSEYFTQNSQRVSCN